MANAICLFRNNDMIPLSLHVTIPVCFLSLNSECFAPTKFFCESDTFNAL